MSLHDKARFNALNADWGTHRIQGYARAAMEAGRWSAFDAPLVSHIVGNLWMGGCIDGVRLPDDFRFVVSLYPWEKYSLGPDTHRDEYKLFDAGEMPDVGLIHQIAESVVRYTEQGKTLVHCQAGLNRSGLISALALIKGGWTAAGAITELRTQRSPVVLCNSTFEQWLIAQDELAA
jgi:hypothetical protein